HRNVAAQSRSLHGSRPVTARSLMGRAVRRDARPALPTCGSGRPLGIGSDPAAHPKPQLPIGPPTGSPTAFVRGSLFHVQIRTLARGTGSGPATHPKPQLEPWLGNGFQSTPAGLAAVRDFTDASSDRDAGPEALLLGR